jgi:hypothetical protein
MLTKIAKKKVIGSKIVEDRKGRNIFSLIEKNRKEDAVNGSIVRTNLKRIL